MMENSDAEIIERYLLYMRYAVAMLEDGQLFLVQYTMRDLYDIQAAYPRITFPRVKLEMRVVNQEER